MSSQLAGYRRHSPYAAAARWLAVAFVAFVCPGCSGTVEKSPATPAEPASTASRTTARSDQQPRSRSFRFHYRFTITGLSEGDKVRVWMPVPTTNRDQTATEIDRTLPAAAMVATEPVHGNRILYLEPAPTAAGLLKFGVSYRVTRREVKGLAERPPPEKISAAQRQTYLAANANVPLAGKPISLLDGISLKKDRLQLARQLYDLVDGHVSYDKSLPGYGRGDAVWVCDSRRGNCSDFHSLFLSLARSRGIPARFEIGFPLPEQTRKGTIAGYHCWAQIFIEGRGWLPVDISEADKHPAMKDYFFGSLTENRVAFSTGRDLVLVPRQAAQPLNFFVDPHVEVNGKTWPVEKIERRYSFEEF